MDAFVSNPKAVIVSGKRTTLISFMFSIITTQSKSYIFCLLFFIPLSFLSLGQVNIAPNPHFEEMTHCPPGQNSALSCSDWYMLNATSDYFNTCGGIGFNQGICQVDISSGIPQNCMGYQHPLSGNGYCGFLAYVKVLDPVSYKEYIAAKLLAPMVAGEKYCVEFYVSLADSSHYAVDEIGAFFGPDSLPQITLEELDLTAQAVNTTGVITDKQNWIKVTGYHVASGTEKFMFIGSYNNYSNTTITTLTEPPLGDTMNGNSYVAYYYVDNVSVCMQESGTCACENAIEPDAPEEEKEDYALPNIFTPNDDNSNDIWTTDFLYDDEYVIILNRWGNEMVRLSKSAPTWDGSVNGAACSDGVYFYIAWMRGEQKSGFIQLIR